MPDIRVCVACSQCRGTGRVELTGEHLLTLQRVRALPGEFTGADVGRLMGIAATAANNRLAALERHGLLASRRFGRKRLYRVEGRS